jgi:hypothetical protein
LTKTIHLDTKTGVVEEEKYRNKLLAKPEINLR